MNLVGWIVLAALVIDYLLGLVATGLNLRALDIQSAKFDDEHRDLGATKRDYAVLLRQVGREEEARSMREGLPPVSEEEATGPW